MTYPELAYDCEKACICDADLSLCPNIQAFGAMAIQYSTVVIRRFEEALNNPPVAE